jgi:phospho-N-acetylmuramoyl-pentapeptide-transferase
MESLTLVKILLPAVIAFCVGLAITPTLTHYLYTYKVWKKKGGKEKMGGGEATVFNALKKEGETKTPRMGGIVIWGSSVITLCMFALLGMYFAGSEGEAVVDFNFLSRSQTWIPASLLVLGALVGFLNDLYDIAETPRGWRAHGLRLSHRLCVVAVLSGYVGWWMYTQLQVSSVAIPSILGGGSLELGALFMLFFIFFTACVYASGVIDGVDGLSGGVFACIFAAYAVLAGSNSQYDLAAFCSMLVGSILAFLWFNIPPARFYMTETGTMALTLCLAAVVVMTDTLGGGVGVAVFPIIALPLVATVASNVLQIIWRKVFRKKLLCIAPLHHHFEAIGWPSYKVTMRYWVVSVVCALLGTLIALTG